MNKKTNETIIDNGKLGYLRFCHFFVLGFQVSVRQLLIRKSVWLGTLVFGACLLILFPFALGTETLQKTEVRYGTFWAIQEFVVALTVSRMFATEQEAGFLELMLCSRVHRSSLFFSKSMFTALQLISLQIPLSVLWVIFYNIGAESLSLVFGVLVGACVLFSVGTAFLGTLIFASTAKSISKEILFPILFFPLQIVILLACVTLCVKTDTSTQLSGVFSSDAWWSILLGYPCIFGALGVLFSPVLFEET
jgi:ABC-type transport system involved in cytochrome c biogenesis permease component